jgi:hypothetical protein
MGFGKQRWNEAMISNPDDGLPRHDLAEEMERFGRYEWEPGSEDPIAIWSEILGPLQGIARSDPPGFERALADAALPKGG